MAEMRRLTDSVGRASMAMTNRAQAASSEGNAELLKKCGDKPAEPEAPSEEPMLTFQDVRNAGVKASGFNDAQYAILRERILPFVVSKGKNSGGLVYTENEAKVLAARLDDLSPYAERDRVEARRRRHRVGLGPSIRKRRGVAAAGHRGTR
jgi:hypothetical protein